ncbi:acyltransferase family protein [Amycolatopsis sp. lyj-346]|uniref:acyltransferase family protein n=1 Tax=Amycolatopsis sp. lyj-346 TaxID=2789289 RepID=UPI003978B20A
MLLFRSDVFFVYGLFFFDPGTTLVLWLSVMLLQSAGAAYAFHLDGEPKSALWLIPMQQLVYRQLMYVVLIQSLGAAVSGILVHWQRMHRIGALRATVRAGAAPAEPVKPRVAPAAEPPPPGRRDRWLDSLRAVALVRIVLYHATGWGWLSLAFPSMGVMFALGGSFMASSLRRTPAVDVVGHRIRRLLPPLWLFGLVAVGLMLAHGWARDTGDLALSRPQLVFWVFPILEPPGSLWGADFTVVLWYLRAYLWFVLLSPVLLLAFRRRPVVTVLAPLAFVAVDAVLGSPLADSGPVGEGVLGAGVRPP